MTDANESNPGILRRGYLEAVGAASALGTVSLAGCLGSDDEPTGTLATQVTDQPGDIADFESCVVTIQGFWIKPRDGEDEDDADDELEQQDEDDADDELEQQDEDDVDESTGREYHEFDEPQEADLVQLQDGTTQLIDERDVAVGEYAFLQLDVSDVDGTLEDGTDAEVGTPGNAPLQFNRRFEIRDGQTTTFVGDFTPVRRGRTDRYLLQPVARGTTVRYEAENTADDAAN